MPNFLKDGYSNFRFFQALLPQDVTDTPNLDGIAIDIKGYETCTFVINVGETTAGGAFAADDFFQLMLEHYNSAAAAWSEVNASQMIHSIVGAAGAYSDDVSGIFISIVGDSQVSTVYAVGYIGPHRTVRIHISGENTPSACSMGAICILGLPANWPVNTPVGYP